MSELKVLTLLELRSLYGLNKYLHTKDKREKNRYRLLAGTWVLVICVVFSYIGGLVYGLCLLGLAEIASAYLIVIASLVMIAFGIFKAGSAIFGTKGYDILASMPVKSSSIVISRFLAMYVEDLLLSLAVMLPGTVVYGACQKPPVGFYLIAFLGTLFIPAIPLVISTLFGTIVAAISARMKRKSIAQTVLTILFVLVVMVGTFSIPSVAMDISLEQISKLATTINEILGKVYLPAVWLGSAMTRLDVLKFFMFLLVSIVPMVLTVWIVAKNFHGIVRRLLNFTAKHDYKIGAMENRSLTKALYLREAKRYFASSVYVTNTIVGPILGAMMAVALCIAGMNTIQNALMINFDITGLLPFAISSVFCMMPTSSVAISMEGKQFWIVKSLPISAKEWLDSKILLNLSLMAPFLLLTEIALTIAVKPDFVNLIWQLLIPTLLMLFTVVLGITINLKFHSFDWEKEETVVKQSFSSMLGGFAGMLTSLLCIAIVIIVPTQYGNVVKGVMCLALLAGTVVLYRKNNKVKMNEL